MIRSDLQRPRRKSAHRAFRVASPLSPTKPFCVNRKKKDHLLIPAIVACRDSVAKYITNPGGQAFNVISGMGIPYRHYYVSARYDFL